MSIYNHTLQKSFSGIYFFTTRIVSGENVFVTKEYFKIIIDSFKFFQDNRYVKTVFYCIMPNHLHWIFRLPEEQDDAISVYRDFKRHVAKEIIKNLRLEIKNGLYKHLDLFKEKSITSRHHPEYLLKIFEYHSIDIKDQKHKIWQEKSDLKSIDTPKFLMQKSNYIHENPIKHPWCLVDEPSEYLYSSAKFYEDGIDWNGLKIEQV